MKLFIKRASRGVKSVSTSATPKQAGEYGESDGYYNKRAVERNMHKVWKMVLF